MLRRAPASFKRPLALRVLGLSPHYFLPYFDPAYDKLSHRQFLEAEFARNRKGREKISREILQRFVSANDTVLDYGCGPGFLAHAVAPHVRQVYALDISRGALECAKILNGADNIKYLFALNEEKERIADESLDVVYSFAVIQHVTDEILREILAFCFRKLRSGGKLVLQVQLEETGWRTEEQWNADKSLAGRVRLSQGLHCFARTAETVGEIVTKSGFSSIEFKNVSEMVAEDFDDICRTQILLAIKT
ncbi:MAG: class I SAM-dependent methyltransferase [Pyrinomonadaceae bacterium]